MRAVRLVAARRLELVDLPEPEPPEGEVVLRVAACGICGSDLSCYKTGVFSGAVLGHEFAGVVSSIGPGVRGWSEGDAAAVDPTLPCGECEDCRAGAGYRCATGLGRGVGGGRDGGLAEYVAVPARALHRLPERMPVEHGSLTEPLSVAVHGVDRAAVRPGEAVSVIGLGSIGLLTVVALRARGAGRIVGIDPVASRREMARSLGADETYEPGGEARAAAAGAPVVAECSGRPEQIQEAANLCAPGGRVLLLGLALSEATLIPMVWITREINLVPAVSSSANDFDDAIGLLSDDPGIARVITKRIPLHQAPRAFEDLLSPADGAKISVLP